MSEKDPVARQRRFYDERAHEHLQARDSDFYASKLAERLAGATGMGPQHRVLEVGAGFGRFTFPLLEHCASIVALDLSEVALEKLERAREARGIDPARCQTLTADLTQIDPHALGPPFDLIAGFFLLHHLPDTGAAIAALAGHLAPGGCMAFVEPNRRNPLYLAQVAACPDMTWKEESGMFRLSARQVEEDYRASGLRQTSTTRFGFFPPQVLNRFRGARALEQRIEKVAALEWVLPFLLLTARAGDDRS